MIEIVTIRAPIIIWSDGCSSITSHTQNDPNTNSRSIIKLTVEALVYFGAMSNKAKEKGKMIIPIAIILKGAEKFKFGSFDR